MLDQTQLNRVTLHPPNLWLRRRPPHEPELRPVTIRGYQRIWPMLTGEAEAEATYIQKVLSYSPIAYWPLNEASGTDMLCQVTPDHDGLYYGVTLGQDGIGDGETCPLLDGSNDWIDAYSAELAAAFDGDEGTWLLWAKVANAGVWTDGSTDNTVRIEVDGSNKIWLYRIGGSPSLVYYRTASGKNQSVNKTDYSGTDWMCLAMTWSVSAGATGQFVAYFNGAQEGATKTGLNSWAGTPSVIRLGTYGTPSNPWNGWLAHAALFTEPLDATAILDLATLPS